jgi:hypothetical protein
MKGVVGVECQPNVIFECFLRPSFAGNRPFQFFMTDRFAETQFGYNGSRMTLPSLDCVSVGSAVLIFPLLIVVDWV